MEPIIKPVPGFKGCFVSDQGEVFSAWSRGGHPHITSVLKKRTLTRHIKGYLFCGVRVKKNLYLRSSAHRLVCLAFHGKPKRGYEASHLNGKRDDNRPENLIWESRSDNHKRKIEHGTHDRGSNNSRALLNANQVAELRELLKQGEMTHKKIGEKFKVSRAFVSKINGGFRYKV